MKKDCFFFGKMYLFCEVSTVEVIFIILFFSLNFQINLIEKLPRPSKRHEINTFCKKSAFFSFILVYSISSQQAQQLIWIKFRIPPIFSK